MGPGPALRPRARPWLQRRHGGRRLLRIPCATTFDYEWATVQHNVNCRLAAAVVVPEAIPARAPVSLRRAGQAPALSRAQGGVLPVGLRAGRGGAGRARAGRWRRRSPWCARRRPCRSTTASRTTCSAACSSASAGLRRSCSRAPRSSGAELSAAGGFIVPERAIDAQSLIAYADLVVSAGGTMNREAVALGTPVFTAVRRPDRGGRRAADRRGPPAAAAQLRRRRAGQAPPRRRSMASGPPGSGEYPWICSLGRDLLRPLTRP